MEPLAKIPKYSIALEHLDRGIELYLRGDSYYSALHLGGAAEEILAVYVREVQEAPAFDQYKDMCVAFSAHESAKEKSAAEKWIYDRMTYAKNSAKHKRGKNDNTVQFDQKEEAYDVIDRAISTYIQLLSYYNLPYLSSLQDFDAQRLAERNS